MPEPEIPSTDPITPTDVAPVAEEIVPEAEEGVEIAEPKEAVSPTQRVSEIPKAASAVAAPASRVDFAVLREKKQEKKRAKLEKILEFAGVKEFIVNDDVEKLLRVSDATSTRYLAQLFKEGRLERVGDPKHASYRLKK